MSKHKPTSTELEKRVKELEEAETERKKAETTLRESEEKHRLLIENSHDIIYMLTRDGIFTFVSFAWIVFLGHPANQVIGQPFQAFVHPDDHAGCLAFMKVLIETGQRQEGIEYRVRHVDGSWRWHTSSVVPLIDEAGAVVGFEGIARDITAQKRVEETLRESEQRLADIFDFLPDATFAIDREGKVIFWNRAMEEMTGVKTEDMLSKGDYEYAVPFYGLRRPILIDLVFICDEEIKKKYHFVRKEPGGVILGEVDTTMSGKNLALWGKARPLYDIKGAIIGAIESIRDVTDHRRTEDALRESEEKHRILLEESSDPIFSFTPEGRYKYVNRAFAKGVGKPVEDIIGKEIWDVFPKEEADKRFASLSQVFRTGEEKVIEVRVPQAGGDRYFVTTITPIKDMAGDVASVICSSKEITERKQAENALRESEERLRLAFEGGHMGLWDCNIETGNVVRNQGWADITGYSLEESQGIEIWKETLHPDDKVKAHASLQAVLEGASPTYKSEYRLRTKTGDYIWVQSRGHVTERDNEGRPKRLSGIITDITEHKQLEEERIKASKLESIGLLAGGIAHDFNNILTALLGNASLAKMVAETDSKMVNELLTESEKACLRARDLTQQLLTFAKGGEPVKKVTAISGLLTSTVKFSLRGSNVRSEFNIQENIWPVEVDAGQISQVIQNLIINADQAMPEGGLVKITGANVELSSGAIPFLNEGKYVIITMEDHGSGIRPEHLQKLFDPYFTTKQKGSGLGLATCYSIVKRHGGHISVESVLGVGSTFSIYLPAATGAIEEKLQGKKDTHIASGRILVMDDEPGIRNVVTKMLKQIGHDVEVASDGAEAIILYKEARRLGRGFDAVLLDLTIPGGMGGKEAIKALLKIDPEVKAIVSSGYSNDPVVAECKKHGFSGVISKPYMIAELKEVLNEVMKKN